MIFLFTAFVCICLYGLKISLKNNACFEDYLSIDKTTAIKGIFIVTIIFSHFNAVAHYTSFGDRLYVSILGVIGQITVVPFLFYSGYGVMESVKKKGDNYLNSFPKNRIFKVWLEFAIAVLLSLFIDALLGTEISGKDILQTFLAWNNKWYVFAILCMYFATYISFKLIKGNRNLNILFVAIFAIVYIFIMIPLKERYWYDTILVYSLGMFFSLYKERIEKLVMGKTYKWVLCCLAFAALSLLMKIFDDFVVAICLGYVFTGIFIILLTMRVSFYNKILYFFGNHLFELYLLHLIPIKICRATGIIYQRPYLSFVLCMAVIIPSAILFKKGYGLLWKKTFGKSSKQTITKID